MSKRLPTLHRSPLEMPHREQSRRQHRFSRHQHQNRTLCQALPNITPPKEPPQFKGHYWQDGYCHLQSPMPLFNLNDIAYELDTKVAKTPTSNPEKLHHRNAHLERHIPLLNDLLHSEELLDAVKTILGESGILVRTTLIDKPPGSPWCVTWHQDRSPLSFAPQHNKPSAAQFKALNHSQFVQQLGDQLVAVRLHLDNCSAQNGGLEIIPNTHRQGLLSNEELNNACIQPKVVLDQPKGSIMFMHPFVLHASAPNISNARRRVIHCEYIKTSALSNLTC